MSDFLHQTPATLTSEICGAPNLCAHVQASLSDYLDGAVSGHEMRRIADHLAACPHCATEFTLAETLQRSLATLGHTRPPADLSLRLRLAISHERTRNWAGRRDQLILAWQNALRPLALQLSAGFACALVLLGAIIFLLGVVAPADTVMANDEPLGAITAPHYLYSVAGIHPVSTPRDETIVVEAAINARGEVYDYKIISGANAPSVRAEVIERLLSSVFRPASVFGVPVRGHVLVTYSGVSVRG